jgi:hypothetical protein
VSRRVAVPPLPLVHLVVHLTRHAPLIRFLLRLLVAAHALPGSDVAQPFGYIGHAFVIISPGSQMTTLPAVIAQLKKERERVQHEVQRIDAALAALDRSTNGTHRMSAAARRRISVAQKARWAKQRAPKPKRTISAAGRRRIAAAQRARWAKISRTT